ncbi:hypothetical protein G6F48_002230 [Rhizopus delemar]|uniref:Uncharacterized protein n=1 Tax=Rhizopus delemar TaxID=936053 RepID=A0A9P7CQ01_9FUNG|nr:hypothetical protein G6F50_006003 [Rhizopus delemar]KAG1593070.1 hypothetical protein G6F48_002230 [Rhizopus delemar]
MIGAMSTMNVLSSIGVNPSGFSKLLCSRFYAQIVRPQMEYGIAINCFNHSQLKSLEEAQDKCICKIYDASRKTSTKVMLHLAKLPTMRERVAILQAQFLFRSLSLPEDTLLYRLMAHIQSKVRTPDYFPAVAQQSLSTLSCGYQGRMKKEVDVYDGALVGCQVELPNPALTIPTTIYQDDTPSAASICIAVSVCLKQ